MIKQLLLILAISHYALAETQSSSAIDESIENKQKSTCIQRFYMYAALYLNQAPTPKEEFFARFKTSDLSDSDFEKVVDNALLANIIEILESMTYDELHDNAIMLHLAQILECKNLENEPTIQCRKAYIVEILHNKNIIAR